MSLGLCFWVIFIVAVVFFGALIGGLFYGVGYSHAANLVVMFLIFLLGWAQFGPPISGR